MIDLTDFVIIANESKGSNLELESEIKKSVKMSEISFLN